MVKWKNFKEPMRKIDREIDKIENDPCRTGKFRARDISKGIDDMTSRNVSEVLKYMTDIVVVEKRSGCNRYKRI